MEVLHRQVDQTQTHLVIHFLSPILFIVQRNLSGFWIQVLSITFCPKRESFASFEKQDGGLVMFDDGHTCHIEGIGTVRIKLSDGMIRELKDVRYIP